MSPYSNLKPGLGKEGTPRPSPLPHALAVPFLSRSSAFGLTSGVGGAEGSVLCPSCLANEALLHPAVAVATLSRSGAGGEMASQPPPPPKPWETRRIPGAGPGPGPTFQ